MSYKLAKIIENNHGTVWFPLNTLREVSVQFDNSWRPCVYRLAMRIVWGFQQLHDFLNHSVSY